jgi:hypothetical protein
MDTKALDSVLMSHIGFFASNLLRSIAYGLTGGIFIFAGCKNAKVKKLERQLTRMSAALALVADACLIILGGSLKRRERISARLGDILSQLYLASAALKYYHDNPQTKASAYYVRWSIQQCLYEIQQSFYALFNNLPQRWLGHILKWCIFPFGQAYQRPSDQLHKKLVAQMIEKTDFRDQLTRYCFISHDENELTHRLETALGQTQANDVLRKKLQQAVKNGTIDEYLSFNDKLKAAQNSGVLTAEEVLSVTSFEALREEIIKVNEFSFDLEQVVA